MNLTLEAMFEMMAQHAAKRNVRLCIEYKDKYICLVDHEGPDTKLIAYALIDHKRLPVTELLRRDLLYCFPKLDYKEENDLPELHWFGGLSYFSYSGYCGSINSVLLTIIFKFKRSINNYHAMMRHCKLECVETKLQQIKTAGTEYESD